MNGPEETQVAKKQPRENQVAINKEERRFRKAWESKKAKGPAAPEPEGTVTLHVSDYRTVCEAVEAFREFVREVRDGRKHDVTDLNFNALFAAQAQSALDQVLA
jgi:hypothetical protein